MALRFQGTALALSSEGLAAVAGSLGVHAPEIWAVLAVETKGCGYLPDRRPQIRWLVAERVNDKCNAQQPEGPWVMRISGEVSEKLVAPG